MSIIQVMFWRTEFRFHLLRLRRKKIRIRACHGLGAKGKRLKTYLRISPGKLLKNQKGRVKEKTMKESERGQQLYICDHAEKCVNVDCGRNSKHNNKGFEFLCSFIGSTVKDIPYKEEPEKSCENCGKAQENGGLCVVDFGCKENGYRDHEPPKEEKPEPKTKRMAVIWFGDVPEGVNNICLDFGNDRGYSLTKPIDPDRLRYGNPKEGGRYLNHFTKDIRTASHDYTQKKEVLIIDPPTPEPETVEDVLKRMPDPRSFTFNDQEPNYTITAYHEIMIVWQKDLKAAQEREV